ncbi:MAG: (Fe-S)-binding protein [Deltaproteobacteria bacterium]|nr:MAG: (Fe-S)-binding protein [Deltaproteobacteria bacterium]
MKVALFATCLTDQFAPRAAEATVRLLRHLGCEVGFPRAQTCCGQPHFNNGYHDEARGLAKRMTRVFRGYDHVVTPSGSCAAHVRHRYPELLPDAGAALAERTWELGAFVTEALGVDPATLGAVWEGRVAVHGSCHYRDLPHGDTTLRLLDGVAGLEAVPLGPAGQCCGFGGTFAVKYPGISGALLSDKLEALREVGPSAVVCNDVGCSLHLAGGCHRAGMTLPFLHAAEVLAEGLGLMPRRPKVVR